jgi:hypothetical protein
MSLAPPQTPPDFAARPSRPRAPLVWRLVVFAALLALACAAIWWIDRGAMLTNSPAQ